MLPSALRVALAVALLGPTVPFSAQEVHQAVQAGELERVTALLDADPAALEMLDENGRTPMHVAALSGQLEVASLFAERGAKMDVADSRGFTPLGLAIMRGNTGMIDLLLGAGADPDGGGGMGLSAIDLAFQQDRQRGTQVTELLITRGAHFDADAPWRSPIPKLHLAANFGRAWATPLSAGPWNGDTQRPF